MEIIKKLKWGKLQMFVWDEEFEQTCGRIVLNEDYDGVTEYCFNPDSIYFDAKQLKEIINLLNKINKSSCLHTKENKNG